MTFRTWRWTGALALLVASGLASFGCSGNEGDGTGGTGGTAGTGGTGAVTIQLPQCILDGYHAIYQEFWGSPSNGLHHILRYVDYNQLLDLRFIQSKARLPADEVLDPLCGAPPPRPRVLWSTFGWPDAGAKRTKYEALFFQAMDDGICEARTFRLDDGFYQNTGAVVDWDIVEEGRKIGDGTFAVTGLDHDSVQLTLVRFPECRPSDTDPADAPLLCADPPPGDPYHDPATNLNPWYDEGVGCRFEVTSLAIHVDLEEVSDPFVFSMEFIAEFGGATDVRGLIVGRDDGTVDVNATYNAQPVTIVINFEAGELTVDFAGEPKSDCTFETDTVKIEECGQNE